MGRRGSGDEFGEWEPPGGGRGDSIPVCQGSTVAEGAALARLCILCGGKSVKETMSGSVWRDTSPCLRAAAVYSGPFVFTAR